MHRSSWDIFTKLKNKITILFSLLVSIFFFLENFVDVLLNLSVDLVRNWNLFAFFLLFLSFNLLFLNYSQKYHQSLLDKVHPAHRLGEVIIRIKLYWWLLQLHDWTVQKSISLLHMLNFDLGVQLKSRIRLWKSDHWLKLSNCNSVRSVLVLRLILQSNFLVVLSKQTRSSLGKSWLYFFCHSNVFFNFFVSVFLRIIIGFFSM